MPIKLRVGLEIGWYPTFSQGSEGRRVSSKARCACTLRGWPTQEPRQRARTHRSSLLVCRSPASPIRQGYGAPSVELLHVFGGLDDDLYYDAKLYKARMGTQLALKRALEQTSSPPWPVSEIATKHVMIIRERACSDKLACCTR